MMSKFSWPLYEADPDDKYYTPMNAGGTNLIMKPVNLNAISYYSSLGMTPRGIGPLIGCTFVTIKENPKMYGAYEQGRAYHQLHLRTVAMEAANGNPRLAYEMLDRVAGKAEEDIADSRSSDDIVEIKATKIELSIVRNEGPERDAIQAELTRVLEIADAKVKK